MKKPWRVRFQYQNENLWMEKESSAPYAELGEAVQFLFECGQRGGSTRLIFATGGDEIEVTSAQLVAALRKRGYTDELDIIQFLLKWVPGEVPPVVEDEDAQ